MYLGSFILKSINKMLETGFKQYQYFIFLQYHKSGFWQSEWMGLRDFQQIVYLAHPRNITFVPWISSFLSSHCSYNPLWSRVTGCVFVYLCMSRREQLEEQLGSNLFSKLSETSPNWSQWPGLSPNSGLSSLSFVENLFSLNILSIFTNHCPNPSKCFF